MKIVTAEGNIYMSQGGSIYPRYIFLGEETPKQDRSMDNCVYILYAIKIYTDIKSASGLKISFFMKS